MRNRNRFLSGVKLHPEEEDEIRDKVREMDNPLETYAPLLNPKLVGIDNKKKAVLLSLASMEDKEGDRGRIHCLLYGKEGTGKSKILTWMRDELNAGYAGKKTTEGGLVGSMAHERPTPGKLPMNHKGVCAVDELDKLSKTDRQGLLECMSDGIVTMTGANVNQEFPANTIIMAAINDRNKLDDKLIHRFDFRIRFSYYDREVGRKILSSKAGNFLKKKGNSEEIEDLKKYLKAVRAFEPKLDNPDKCEEVIEEFLNINNVEEVQPRNHIDRFLRVGVAHARLNFRNPRTIDFVRAIEILLQDSYPELRRVVND